LIPLDYIYFNYYVKKIYLAKLSAAKIEKNHLKIGQNQGIGVTNREK
jgi:hypothetical protein